MYVGKRSFSRRDAVFLALAQIVLIAACGSSGDSTTAGTGTFSSANCAAFGCPSGLQCAPDLGCVKCTSDAQCGGATPHCVSGACEECSGNADCPVMASACWLGEHHQCHAPCTSSAECPRGNHCEVSTRRCLECATDDECASNGNGKPVCNTLSGHCGTCRTDAQCVQGGATINNTLAGRRRVRCDFVDLRHVLRERGLPGLHPDLLNRSSMRAELQDG